MEFWDAVGYVDCQGLCGLPVGVVEESVVTAAERDTVVETGWTMINPVHNVVKCHTSGQVVNIPGMRIRRLEELPRGESRWARCDWSAPHPATHSGSLVLRE
jgi:hypothetical protein